MRRAGWLRLWIVVTVIGVPIAALEGFQSESAFWVNMDKVDIKMCVDAEADLSTHPDALKCAHTVGADQTYFQHEHVAPLTYWSERLVLYFILDCILTALLVGAYFVVRWVVNGFRAKA